MTYFNTYGGAVRHAISEVEKKGYKLSEDEIFNVVGIQSFKPKEGQTETLHLSLRREDDSLYKEYLHISVYNRGNHIGNNMELNFYVL